MNKKHKVLILAGGGLFGYVITYFLSQIKYDFIPKIDTIAGTSIGGILSLMYATCPDRQYINEQFKIGGKKIFQKSPFSFLNFRGPKYSNKNLKSFIELFLQDFTLDDLFQINKRHLNVIIPTLDFNKKVPKVFDNIDPEDNDLSLVQLALATSAAPTYFPAIQYKDMVLIDGGVLENIPITTTMVTLKSKKNIKFEDMDVFVIGTGNDAVIQNYTADQVTNFTLGDWAFKFLVPFVTESNETCSMYWWTKPNLGFNSFTLFNPIKICGKMDDPKVLNNIENWCRPFLGLFKEQFEQFLSR